VSRSAHPEDKPIGCCKLRLSRGSCRDACQSCTPEGPIRMHAAAKHHRSQCRAHNSAAVFSSRVPDRATPNHRPPKGSLQGGVPRQALPRHQQQQEGCRSCRRLQAPAWAGSPKWSVAPCSPLLARTPNTTQTLSGGFACSSCSHKGASAVTQYACHAAGARHNSPNQGAQASGAQCRFLFLNSRPQSNPQGKAPPLGCMCAVCAARCSAQNRGSHTSHKQTLGNASLPPHICAPDNTTQMQHLKAPT
jgi:hypothetical protein